MLKHYSSYRDGEDGTLYNYDYWLRSAYNLLDRSSGISQKDKELVRAFADHLRVRSIGTGRVAKHVFKLRIMLEILGVDVEKATRKDVERLVLRLEEKQFRPVTLIDYLFIIKRFFKFAKYGNVDRENPYPEEVAWIKRRVKPNEGRRAEFFTPAEVRSMIVAAEKLRDKAMIAVGFEGGFRTGELLGLEIRDLSFDQVGVRAKVRGKTGERIVRLISSAPLLTAYLETHPEASNPVAPLWLTEVGNWKNRRASWRSWNNSLRYIAKKAGIKGKRVHSYLLRHGSATDAARYLTDAEMKVRYGWTMDSGMPAVYVHLSSQDLDPKLAKLYSGKPMEPQKPEFSPDVCPRCSEANTPGMRFCGKCGMPLNRAELARSSIDTQEMKNDIQDIKKLLGQLLSKPLQEAPGESP
ncbi:MAG: tyrosine-type recombinase/integrase [Nitrososphaerota archaeon]|nr:tyrosine-type recombinase/integrase [Nitrososphaerota archaeon]